MLHIIQVMTTFDQMLDVLSMAVECNAAHHMSTFCRQYTELCVSELPNAPKRMS